MPDFLVTEFVRITADTPSDAVIRSGGPDFDGKALDKTVDGYNATTESPFAINALITLRDLMGCEFVVVTKEDLRNHLAEVGVAASQGAQDAIVERAMKDLDLTNDAVMEAVWEAVSVALKDAIKEVLA